MPYVGIGVDPWTRLIQHEFLHDQRKSPEMVDPGMIIKIDKQNPWTIQVCDRYKIPQIPMINTYCTLQLPGIGEINGISKLKNLISNPASVKSRDFET